MPARALDSTALAPTAFPSARLAPEPCVWTQGQRLTADIVLERLLGRGGMGEVFLARRASTGEPFAVKRATLGCAASRSAFFEEVQGWIDLAPHPHVVRCHFVRTIGSELAVFAEYVDGGSLEEAIEQGRVGGWQQVLDLGAQLAWGLDAAHVCGLVHQDVKPANALLTRGGVLKVGDFGLARLRSTPGSGEGDSAPVLGMTPAFCSPEQAGGGQVGRGTDVWSFGLTVLAMAVGGPGWKFGFDAPRSLERYRTGKLASKLGALPDPIASVLERCFRQEPSSRWASLAEAAEALCAAHRELFGRDLDRARPAPVVLSAPPPSFGRRLSTGASWRPAAEWLAFALQAAGQDARGGLEGAPASEHRSLLARAIADLGKLDRAETILRELADAGARELAGPLAAVRFERAIVHEFAGDHAGASASLDRSIEGLRGARAEDLDEPGQDLLAAAIDYRGLVDLAASRPEDALPRHEQAVAIRIAMGGRAPGSRFAGEMAASLLNRATASHALGRLRESLADIDDALALLEGAPAEVRESPFGLTCRARALLGRSSACRSLGDHAGALRAVDEALESAPALRDDEPALVAWLLRNRGMTLVSLGHARAAFGDYETAVGLLESAVVEQGRDELAADLGLARMNFAFALGRGGERGAAFEQFDKATVTLEDLVERAGRTDLENELARLCVNHAVVRIEAGEASRAVVLARRAVAIRERLVVEQGQAHREADLALALRHLGLALFEADEAEAAIEPLERAVRMLDGRVGAGDAAVAFSTLAQAQADLGRALARCARPSDSLCALERAAAGFEALLATGGSQEVAPFLASVRLQRASLLGALEGPAAARRALEELVGALEAANEFPGGLGARDDLVVEALEQRRVLDEQARDRAGVRAGLEAILRVLARTGADGADAGRALVLARRCVAAAMQVGGEGDHEAARELTTRAIAALERALEGRGADECIGDLACARILRAVAGFNLGQVEQARTDARQGIAVLSVEAPRTGRRDLQQMLTWALSTLPVAPKG